MEANRKAAAKSGKRIRSPQLSAVSDQLTAATAWLIAESFTLSAVKKLPAVSNQPPRLGWSLLG
jgi:hypothetical protein